MRLSEFGFKFKRSVEQLDRLREVSHLEVIQRRQQQHRQRIGIHFLRLTEFVKRFFIPALLAVCHRLPEQLVHLKAVLGIGKLFADGIGNSAGGGCHVAQSMQSVQKGWVCEFFSACLFA